jgi:hypothetical protein
MMKATLRGIVIGVLVMFGVLAAQQFLAGCVKAKPFGKPKIVAAYPVDNIDYGAVIVLDNGDMYGLSRANGRFEKFANFYEVAVE